MLHQCVEIERVPGAQLHVDADSFTEELVRIATAAKSTTAGAIRLRPLPPRR